MYLSYLLTTHIHNQCVIVFMSVFYIIRVCFVPFCDSGTGLYYILIVRMWVTCITKMCHPIQ